MVKQKQLFAHYNKSDRSTYSHVSTNGWPWHTAIDTTNQPITQCTTLRSHRLYGNAPLLMDCVDTSIFDYLTGNTRRHVTHMFAAVHPPMLLFGNMAHAFRVFSTTQYNNNLHLQKPSTCH
jgi:hypothetical protein